MSIKIISAIFEAEFSDLKDGAGNVTKASTAALVLLALADHASEDGRGAYPSLTTMESKTKLSHQTILSAYKTLMHNGIITCVGKSKVGTSNYTINTGCFPDKKGEDVPLKPVECEDSSHLSEVLKPVECQDSSHLSEGVKPVECEDSSHLSGVLKPVELNRPLTVLKPNKDDEEEERAKKLRELYFANFGIVPPLLLETFRKAARRFTNSDWYEPAFQIAVGNEARSWRYVETILEDWLVNGFGHKPERASPGQRGARSKPTLPTFSERLQEYINTHDE